MSKRSSVFMAAIALLSVASCQGNTPAANSVTSAPVSEKSSEVFAKTLPVFTATIAGHKHDGTPIVTPYSGEKVKCSYTCTSDGAVTQKWYKGKEELKEAPKDIGEYTYYLSVEETATYKSASAQFSFTIVTANVATKPWSDLEDTTWIPYDGKPHSLKVEDSPYYTVNGNLATEPGDYLVTATLKPGYAWSDGTTDPVERHLAIRKEYEATMRAVVDSYEPELEEDQTYCKITIKGTELGKVYTGMQVTFIDDYGRVLGKATVDEMINVQTDDAVTEVGKNTEAGKDNKTRIQLDGINPNVIAHNTTKTYLISLNTYTTWEPKIIKKPTTSSEGVAVFGPNEEPNVQIPVVLPKLSAADYEYFFTETVATCKSEGVDVYKLKHDSAELAVYGSSLYKEEYIKALQNLEFDVKVQKNPNNHTGTSHYDWSTAASMPTYDILTNNHLAGKAVKYCDACNKPIANTNKDVEYTDGMWQKNTAGTYDRVYTFDHGTLKGDTGRKEWNVHVDTNGGTARKDAFTDATPKVDQSHSIQIYVSRFENTGYTFDSITYYVDGASPKIITKSMTEKNNRVYYAAGATDPQFIIHTGTHSNNNYTGDVYVKINWTKDA